MGRLFFKLDRIIDKVFGRCKPWTFAEHTELPFWLEGFPGGWWAWREKWARPATIIQKLEFFSSLAEKIQTFIYFFGATYRKGKQGGSRPGS